MQVKYKKHKNNIRNKYASMQYLVIGFLRIEERENFQRNLKGGS